MQKYQEIRHPDCTSPAAANQNEPPMRTATLHIGESALTWLYAHKRISSAQLLAGTNLQKDFIQAGLMPNITMGWGDYAAQARAGNRANRSTELTTSMLDARRRFNAAMDHVGPGLSDICWRAICAGESIGDTERSLNWPARSGRLVLTLALDRLVQYYRIGDVESA